MYMYRATFNQKRQINRALQPVYGKNRAKPTYQSIFFIFFLISKDKHLQHTMYRTTCFYYPNPSQSELNLFTTNSSVNQKFLTLFFEIPQCYVKMIYHSIGNCGFLYLNWSHVDQNLILRVTCNTHVSAYYFGLNSYLLGV